MTTQKRVLAVIMGAAAGRGWRPLPWNVASQQYPRRQVPARRHPHQQLHQLGNQPHLPAFPVQHGLAPPPRSGAYQFDPFGGGFVDILSAEQTEKSLDWYQGTADAVRRNLIHFRKYPHDLILILSGDQLYRMDFRSIIEQHLATGADVTISAKPFPVSKVEGLGLMRVGDDLSIQEFVEKPKDPAVIARLMLSDTLDSKLTDHSEKHCLASMGIYVFNRAVLAEALENSMTDFGREVIPSLLGRKKMFAHIFEDTGRTSAPCARSSRRTSPWRSRCPRSTSSTRRCRCTRTTSTFRPRS